MTHILFTKNQQKVSTKPQLYIPWNHYKIDDKLYSKQEIEIPPKFFVTHKFVTHTAYNHFSDTKKKAKESVKLASPTSRFSVIKKAASKHRKDRREERATRIMLIIMLCFIVCWMPFFIMYITRSALSISCPNCISSQVQVSRARVYIILWC